MPRPPRLMVRSVLNYEKGRTSNQTFSLMRGPLVLKKRLLSSQLGISRAQSVLRQHRLPSSNYITTTAAAPSGAFVPSIILRYPPIIPLVRQQSAQKRRSRHVRNLQTHRVLFCLLGQPSPGSCQSIPVPLLMVNGGVRIGIDLHFFVNCILRRRRRPTSTSCMHFAEVSTTSASCEDDRGDLDPLHGYSKQSPTQTPPIRPRLIPSYSLNARSTWNQFFKQLSFFSRPVCFLSFESTIRITPAMPIVAHPPATTAAINTTIEVLHCYPPVVVGTHAMITPVRGSKLCSR